RLRQPNVRRQTARAASNAADCFNRREFGPAGAGPRLSSDTDAPPGSHSAARRHAHAPASSTCFPLRWGVLMIPFTVQLGTPAPQEQAPLTFGVPDYGPTPPDMPIPDRLNRILVAIVFSCAVALLWLGSQVDTWYYVLLVGIAFSYLMLTDYALLHEAAHGN